MTDQFWSAWQAFMARMREHGAADAWLALARLTTLGERPVEIRQLAETIRRPEKDAVELAARHREFQIHGRFISMDPSAGTQRRRLRIGDRIIGASGCAPDVLMWAAVLDRPLRVEEDCPITATPIQIDLTPARVERARPAESVVVFQAPPGFRQFIDMNSDDIDAQLCAQAPSLSSAHAAPAWISGHEGVRIVPVTDAYMRVRGFARQFLDAWGSDRL